MKISDKELQQIKDRGRAIGHNEGYDKGFTREFELGEFTGTAKTNNSWFNEHKKFMQFLKRIYPQSMTNPKADKEIEEILEKNE